MIQDCDYLVFVLAFISTLFAGEVLRVSENRLRIDLEDVEAELPGPLCRVSHLLLRHRAGITVDTLMPEVPKWVRYLALSRA